MAGQIDPIEIPNDAGEAIVSAWKLLLQLGTAPLVEEAREKLENIENATQGTQAACGAMDAKLLSIDGKLTGLQPKLDQIVILLQQIANNTAP